MTAIGFRMAEDLSEILAAPRVDLAFTPKLNTYRGETSIDLVLRDVRPA